MKAVTVGKLFSDFIEKHGLTQKNFSEIVGISENQVNKYINGYSEGSEQKFRKYERILKDYEVKLKQVENIEHKTGCYFPALWNMGQ